MRTHKKHSENYMAVYGIHWEVTQSKEDGDPELSYN
jgi:hypothetical protein